jgi:hypothetical protein
MKIRFWVLPLFLNFSPGQVTMSRISLQFSTNPKSIVSSEKNLRSTILSFFMLVSLPFITAQSQPDADAPKIFIDCHTRCHQEFIRQEVTYVNHMRDRQTADVFIQVTGQRTEAGSRKYFLEFQGQQRFEGITDTIEYFTEPNSSESDQRNLMKQYIEKGLLTYLVQTSVRDQISFSVTQPATSEEAQTENTVDPWNLWTFNLRANGNVSGQESVRSTYLSGRFNAGKVTEDFKWTSRAYFNYSSDFYQIDEEESVTNVVTNSGFSSTYVKSVSDHVSVGAFGRISESTFSNYDLSLSFQPAIEFNAYPYMEANKRQFTVLYRIGPIFNDYVDTTIFNLTNELIWSHRIELNFQKIESWGNLDIEISYGNYLHDWQLAYASIDPQIELNLFKGFFLDIGGSFEMTRNQINLPKEDASRDDVLLQIRQLKSNYNYGFYIGFSYRFGSNYANIVNVRF